MVPSLWDDVARDNGPKAKERGGKIRHKSPRLLGLVLCPRETSPARADRKTAVALPPLRRRDAVGGGHRRQGSAALQPSAAVSRFRLSDFARLIPHHYGNSRNPFLAESLRAAR